MFVLGLFVFMFVFCWGVGGCGVRNERVVVSMC